MSVSPSGSCSTVTVNDDGSAVVASCGAVINQTGGTIADGSVTYAKIQNTAAGRRLIGRPESTAGTVSEVSLGTGLKFSGSSIVTDAVVSDGTQVLAGTGLTGGGALTGNVTLSANFGTAAGTVCQGNDTRLTDARTPTTHKTSHATGGTDAIAPADIGAAAVTHTFVTVNDETATLTGSRRLIGGGAVTINTGTSGVIQLRRAALTGDVTASENNNTLTIANDAVTFAKMQNLAANTLIGRATASTGDPEAITCTAAGRSALAASAPTSGQLLIGNGVDFSLATLTQGSGVTITNGAGTITIAATGGSAFDPATKSESFCDFIGDATSPFANAGAGTGSTITYTVAGNSDHPGVAEVATGTASTGRRFVGSSQVDELVFGTRSHTFSTSVTVPTLSDATDTYTVFAGFFDLLTGTPTNGAYFRYSHGVNGGDWQCVTANASTETTTDSNVAVTASTWNRLDIEVNAAGTSVVFKVDGNTVATHTTNIPTAGVGVGCNIRKSAGTTSRTFQMDYLYHSSAVTR